jgi:hypothetical protein
VNVRLLTRGEHVLDKLSSAHEEQLRRIGPELAILLTRLTANGARSSRSPQKK